MGVLDGWTRGEHADPDASLAVHPTYRKGVGPGVVIIAEIPGITPDVVAFAEAVVAQGFTVVLPHLFGDVPSAAGRAWGRSACASPVGSPWP